MRDAGEAEVRVDVELAARLVAEQFPQYASTEFGRRYIVDDHVAVRLGDELGVWLPTTPAASASIDGAARLAKLESARWTFPASVQVAAGEPTDYYPFRWQIVNWYGNSSAAVVPLTDAACVPLARALREVHHRAPADAPHHGGSMPRLADGTKEMKALLESTRSMTGPDGQRLNHKAVSEYWRAGVEAELDSSPTWVHGSLGPFSVLSDHGDFAGICNWHHFGAGDPAIDLGAMTALLPTFDLEDAWQAYGAASTATRARSAAYCKLTMLRSLASPDPFLANAAWATISRDPHLLL